MMRGNTIKQIGTASWRPSAPRPIAPIPHDSIGCQGPMWLSGRDFNGTVRWKKSSYVILPINDTAEVLVTYYPLAQRFLLNWITSGPGRTIPNGGSEIGG